MSRQFCIRRDATAVPSTKARWGIFMKIGGGAGQIEAILCSAFSYIFIDFPQEVQQEPEYKISSFVNVPGIEHPCPT